MNKKIIIEGWGSLDLLKLVRNAGWEPCLFDGRNLAGMNLGGYALTDTPDELTPVKYRVALEAVESGSKFIVDGYCFPDLLMAVEKGEPVWGPTTFAGQKLTKKPKKGTRFYRVTIEAV